MWDMDIFSSTKSMLGFEGLILAMQYLFYQVNLDRCRKSQ